LFWSAQLVKRIVLRFILALIKVVGLSNQCTNSVDIYRWVTDLQKVVLLTKQGGELLNSFGTFRYLNTKNAM
jgi:hypothetical protein